MSYVCDPNLTKRQVCRFSISGAESCFGSGANVMGKRTVCVRTDGVPAVDALSGPIFPVAFSPVFHHNVGTVKGVLRWVLVQ